MLRSFFMQETGLNHEALILGGNIDVNKSL